VEGELKARKLKATVKDSKMLVTGKIRVGITAAWLSYSAMLLGVPTWIAYSACLLGVPTWIVYSACLLGVPTYNVYSACSLASE